MPPAVGSASMAALIAGKSSEVPFPVAPKSIGFVTFITDRELQTLLAPVVDELEGFVAGGLGSVGVCVGGNDGS